MISAEKKSLHKKKYRLKKNDTVKVIAGKDKGKTGRILRIDKDRDRVVVEGVNIVKKAVKKRRENDTGGIIEIEASIHISNVTAVTKNGDATRVGFAIQNNEKVRIARKTGEQL
jgi:large subunit ribosomal protein L24